MSDGDWLRECFFLYCGEIISVGWRNDIVYVDVLINDWFVFVLVIVVICGGW